MKPTSSTSRFLCAVVLIVLSAAHARAADATALPSHVASFLKKHCVRCHGPKTQNGERRFDQLPPGIADTNTLADYQDILDQLNLSEMPPADEPQPTDAERSHAVAWFTNTIQTFHSSRRNHRGETTLRRLNSREYRNTIRDLFF